MLRFLLASSSLFVLLFTSIVLPRSAAACPERMPVTLLSLYRSSDSIFVGRYERTEDGAVTEETADYTVVPIKKHFSISSALKGETRKMLVLEDTEYRYKTAGSTDEVDGHDGGEDSEDADGIVAGDSVLLFLKMNEETEMLDATDYLDGIKKMTPEKLSAYESRIRELNGMFSNGKPTYSQVVGWLIRCAEDPLTRWEGTFDLLQSFQNLDWQEERAKQAKEKGTENADGEPVESDEFEIEAPKEFDTGDPNIAGIVTGEQKEILTKILLERERPEKPEGEDKGAAAVHGDRELIELVKRWGDHRVAASMIDLLRLDSADASQNAQLMASIAAMLNDNELTAVSEEFSNIQWETAEDEVRGDNAEENTVDGVPSPDAPPQTDEADAIKVAPEPVVDNAASPPDETRPAAKKKTYGDVRGELLAKFFPRADALIAVAQERASAERDR